MSVPAWVERYVGIPFRDDGFGFSGCHCWGLVRLLLLVECKIELPTYGEISAKDLQAASVRFDASAHCDPWIPVVNGLRAFDVIRMREYGGRGVNHVGIMVDGFNVLHVEEITSSVCVPLSHPSVRHRLAGTFRHKSLA